jgi:hypothetical protein
MFLKTKLRRNGLCDPWFNKVQRRLSNMQHTNWLLQVVTIITACMLLTDWYRRHTVGTNTATHNHYTFKHFHTNILRAILFCTLRPHENFQVPLCEKKQVDLLKLSGHNTRDFLCLTPKMKRFRTKDFGLQAIYIVSSMGSVKIYFRST